MMYRADFEPDELKRIRMKFYIPYILVIVACLVLVGVGFVLGWSFEMRLLCAFPIFFPVGIWLFLSLFGNNDEPVTTVIVDHESVTINNDRYEMNRNEYHTIGVTHPGNWYCHMTSRQLEVKDKNRNLIKRYWIGCMGDKENNRKLDELTLYLRDAYQKAFNEESVILAEQNRAENNGNTVVEFPVGKFWIFYILAMIGTLIVSVGCVLWILYKSFRFSTAFLAFLFASLFVMTVYNCIVNMPKVARKIVITEVNGQVFPMDEISTVNGDSRTKYMNSSFFTFSHRGKDYKYYLGPNLDEQCSKNRRALAATFRNR